MSDQDTTQQLPPPDPPPRETKRLLRSSDDRVIAGVCAGLGRYFGIDPVIVRIAFAVSIFFGGLGVLAYIALTLFVPSGDAAGQVTEPPVERSRALAIGVGIGLVVIALSWGIFDGPFWGGGFFLPPALFVLALVALAILVARRAGGGSGPRGALATILLAFVALIVLGIAALAAGWAAATGHGVAVAAIVIGIGLLLIVAAFNGGARWLIAPAIALAVPLGVVSAADISFGDGVGERDYRPLSSAAVEDRYELGIGSMVVDLRDLEWSEHEALAVEVDLGVGQAIVAVPEDVCVTTDFDVRAGDMRVAGDRSDGFDLHSAANAGATATPRLDLTGEVDLGEVWVINDDDAEIEGHGRAFHDEYDDAAMRSAMESACDAATPTGDAADPGEPGDGGGGR